MLPSLAIALLPPLLALPPGQEPDAAAPPSAPQEVAAAGGELDALVTALREGERRARLDAVARLPALGADAVAPLADALDDRVAEVRREAARALGELGPVATPAAEALVAAAGDELEDVRRAAWRALGELGPGAAPDIARAAVEREPPGSLRALLALGRLDAGAPEVLAAALPVLVREGATPGERAAATAVVVRAGAAAHADLSEALLHPVAASRAAAARALGAIEVDDPRARAALIAASTDDDATVRARAVWALGRLRAADDEALAALAQRLEDEAPEVQAAAVAALGRAGAAGLPTLLAAERALWTRALTAVTTIAPDDAAGPVFELVEDPEEAVERAVSAVVVVQRWGPDARAYSTRLARLLDHPRTWMRVAALRALNWTGYDEPMVADLLELALQHEDARIRAPAAAALGHATGRPDSTVIAMAAQLRDDSEPSVRQVLAWVLGELDRDPQLIVPALVQALDDPDAGVRLEAAGSIRRLGPRAFPAAERLVRALVPATEDDEDLAAAAREALLAMGPEAHATLLRVAQTAPDAALAGEAMDVLLESGTASHDELRELARHDRARVRVLATVGLLRDGLAPTKALQAFIDGVKDRHDDACAEGARALAALGSPGRSALNALTDALERTPPPVRVELVRAIAAVAGDRRSGVQALVEVLEEDAEGTVRVAAAEALGRLGEQAERAERPLLGVLAVEDPALRAAAVEALGGIGVDSRAAAQAVCARLEDDASVDVRRAAALALGRMPGAGDEALDVLRAALADPEPAVAAGAALGLAHLGDAATADVPRLADGLLAHADADVRLACATALERLGPAAFEATPALAFTVLLDDAPPRVDPLLEGDDDPPVRPIAADELVLETTQFDVRVAAARALGAIGPAAEDALPALDRAVGSGPPRLTEAALRAIASIRP